MTRDRLASVERAAVLEELASTIRHDLRNRLAAIKNASFYLKTKARGSALWRDDKLVPRFFQVIEEELAAANDLIVKNLSSPLAASSLAPVSLADAAEEAIACAAVPAAVVLERSFADTPPVEADPVELVLLIRCLIDEAVAGHPDGGRVLVRTRIVEGETLLEVEGGRAPPPAEDPPMGLKIVRRIAARYGGGLTVGDPMTVRFPYSEPSVIVGT